MLLSLLLLQVWLLGIISHPLCSRAFVCCCLILVLLRDPEMILSADQRQWQITFRVKFVFVCLCVYGKRDRPKFQLYDLNCS